MAQATLAYAEKNPRKFLFLIFIFAYFVAHNYQLLSITIFFFCCLIYQVQI